MKCKIWLLCVLLLAVANARFVNEVKRDAAEKGADATVAEIPISSELEGADATIAETSISSELEAENQNTSSHTLPELIPPPKCPCNWRYLKHYAAKQCVPVFEEGCDCPARYDCPQLRPSLDGVCEYKGRIYRVGDEIKTSSTCDICSCRNDPHAGVGMTCIPIECPSGFRRIDPESGCYEVFEAGKCCSVEIKCPGRKKQGNVTEVTCEYGGKTYRKGQRIYPKEDPCMSCLCDENWAGISVDTCHIHDCLLERKLGELRRGCIPIYHEKTCCPIEYHCKSRRVLNTRGGITSKSDVGTGSGENLSVPILKSYGECVFEGKSYAVGEELDIGHPTSCVTCICRTPPDFTCVHRSCSGPPNGDYENCMPSYHKGICCPTYNCPLKLDLSLCEPVECGNKCEQVYGPDGCPVCLCDEHMCAIPKCPDGCDVEYDVPQGSCPRCNCPITVHHSPVPCTPVRCGRQCFEVVRSDGCPSCHCAPLCFTPKCDEGCKVQDDYGLGQCPGCVCPGSVEHGQDDKQIHCAPVKCAPACRELLGQYGCPACICDIFCSAPKCGPGCVPEKYPSSGPCPACECKDKLTQDIKCDPVKCDPGCRETSGESGCPTCVCDPPLCSPPKCDPGCEVELVPSSGPCPGCVCKDNQTAAVQCAPVKCAPTCREAIGQFGCPTCLCDPLCSPPKCDPGCEVETVPSSGPCPGCVCGDLKTAAVQCAPVKCAPTCREAVGQFGCPTCLCDPLCSPPKCDPGCEVETVPSSGPCPGCVCPNQKTSDIQCAPVKCGPTCREAIGGSGCPTCLCDPMCSPPKCDPGCEIETVPSSGPCPGCVCEDKKGRQVQCAPVKCGPQCREAMGQFGCPVCLCDPLCSPPKCDPGCEIELVPSSGPCPGCVCKDQPEAKVQCAPVKCGPQCREAVGQYGCATCLCDPACSPPKCDPGCRVEVVPSLGPCPGCVCDDKEDAK